jgi:hypothetical protein
MSEIAVRDESRIDLLPPAQPMSSNALAVLREHSQAMDIAFKYAQAVCGTKVCPARFYQKPEDGAAAILYGLEIGLSPSAALQKVVVIHGMPSLEARTMVALLKPRGYKVWTVSQSDESVTVAGRDLDGDVHESTWTIERATKAGYVPEINPSTKKYKTNANGKLIGNEKYLTDPQAMLKAKAQAEVCRDMAPDVLLGITYSTEDLESERWDDRVVQQVEDRPARNEPVTVDEILGTNAVEPPAAEAAEAAPTEEGQATGNPSDASVQPQPETEHVEPDGYDDNVAEADPEPKPAAAEPETPAAEAEPERTVSKMRAALERRLFKLLKAADLEDREDRLIFYAGVLADREEPITSTNDLSDTEVAAISDQIFVWEKAGELNDRITDILNSAALREVEEQEKQATNNTEGQ